MCYWKLKLIISEATKKIIVSLNVPKKDIGRDIRYDRKINTLMPT